jgi:glycosyltransferase involved in cell wall biosynthesis
MLSTGQRLKVLISAYACEPDKGSEPEVGWQSVLHMAQYHDVTVLTRSNNRENIERGLAQHTGARPEFIYYDLPGWIVGLKKRVLGVALYYFLWQIGARFHLHNRLGEFDLIHHSTFNSFRQPGCWWWTGRPVVIGPLGGGQICPWRHLPWFRRSIFYELIRSTSVANSFLMPNVLLSLYFADRILVANRDTWRSIPWFFRDRTQPMLETAVQPSQIIDPHPQRTWKAVRFLWISRLDKRKGGELALRALAETRRRYANISLTIIGRGPEEKPLHDLVDELGITDIVTFIPAVPKDEVQNVMAEHDAFVFTSMRDTSGNVILEAMAAGLPVITLNHQGAAEITTHETALRVPVGRFKDIVRHLGGAMATLAGSHAWRSKLGDTGRERVRNLYTWPVFARKMSGVYMQAREEKNVRNDMQRRSMQAIRSPKGLAWSFIVLLLVALLEFSSIRYLRSTAASIVNDTLPGLSYAGAINSTLTDSFNRTLLAILAGDEQSRARYVTEIQGLSAATTENMKLYEQSAFSPEDRALYARLASSREHYLEVRGKILATAARPGSRDEALRIYFSELSPSFEEVKKSGSELLRYNIEAGKTRGRNIMTACIVTQIVVALLGVVIFLAGFLLGFFK